MKITNSKDSNEETEKSKNGKKETKIRIVDTDNDIISFKSLIAEDRRAVSSSVTKNAVSILLLFISAILLLMCAF